MSAHLTTDGYTFYVDDGDDELACIFSWHTRLSGSGLTRYARARIPGSMRRICLHTLLAGRPGLEVDHKDGDGLNNRKLNLRPANDSQNAANQKLNRRNTSGFKGVSASISGWKGSIGVAGKILHLGFFSTPQDAALAYDTAAILHFGEFARTNAMLGLL